MRNILAQKSFPKISLRGGDTLTVSHNGSEVIKTEIVNSVIVNHAVVYESDEEFGMTNVVGCVLGNKSE